VSTCDWSALLPADKQSAHLAKNVGLLLNGKPALPYKVMTHRKSSNFFDVGVGVGVENGGLMVGIAGITGIQIGRKAGIGHFDNWAIPSFAIIYIRRMLFLQWMESWLDGTRF